MPDTNAIDPRVFPSTARRGSSCGELKIQNVRASDLAAEYGTPLYLIDEPEVRATATRVREAFETECARIGSQAKVFYAGKALLNVAVAEWMTEEGLGIDVSSGGELAVALAAGVSGGRIGFHGNNKSVAEIRAAVDAGVASIIIDSEQEITRVAEIAAEAGVRQSVMLRVNSGVHASTHDFLATSHEDQKFGVSLDEAERLVQEIRTHASLDFRGLHCHIGSQIFATEGFRESARRLLGLYPRLGDVPELNLGGGFGIAYTSAEAAQVTPIEDIARQIADIVADTCAELGISVPLLSFEPGRSIVGQAGVTLYTVGTTKPVAIDDHADDSGQTTRLYVSVDGGMSDNARTALYDAQYTARLANRRSEAPEQLCRIVGKHCESGDIVVSREMLPADIAPGDLVAVAATGAYCWSLSSNYNYVPRPPVVAVNDGTSRLIVRGQTIDDLVAQSVMKNGA